MRESPATEILSALDQEGLLPAILFRTARRQCDVDIERLFKEPALHLPEERQQYLVKLVDDLIVKYAVDPLVVKGHTQYEALVMAGAGAHHAGQLLVWRLILEELMSAGVLRLLVATGTVAAGVDYPARSVVITAHSRRGPEGYQNSSASEFQQMSGRAGRRGKDAVGFCIIAPGPFSDARILHQVSRTPPEPLKSAYYAAPSTVLNLLKYRSVDELRFTVSKSLGAFADNQAAKDLESEVEKLRARSETTGVGHTTARKKINSLTAQARRIREKQIKALEQTLKGLEQLGFTENGILSPKGSWSAVLCTNLVLYLSEAVNEGIFDGITKEELVGIIAAISGDGHRRYLTLRKDSSVNPERLKKLERIVARIGLAYPRPPGSDQISVNTDAAITAITWMQSESWEEFSGLLRLGGVAEGDVSRLIAQTAEHLNQLTKLKDTHMEIAVKAHEGRLSIMRSPFVDF